MAGSVLYVNACVRAASRTRELAEKLLARLDRPTEEVRLADLAFPAVSEEYLSRRDRLIAAGETDDEMFSLARQFAGADVIVIAAPYWDLSFPAVLKQYLELVNVVGLTFRYSEAGAPIGMCRANRLYYVTTAGGHFAPDAFGFGYVKALAENYYGIRDVRKIEALGLDIEGADVPAIMKSAEKKILETAIV